MNDTTPPESTPPARPRRRITRATRAALLGLAAAAAGAAGVAWWLGGSEPSAPRGASGATKAALALVLTGPGGKPADAVAVRCAPPDGPAVETSSNAAGRARCNGLPPGSVTVVAMRPGLARKRVRLVLSAGEREAAVSLEAAAPIEGQVVDDLGQPIAGARLSLELGEGAADAEPWTALSDADGRFVFDTTPAGVFSLDASADGHERAVLPRLKAPPPEPVLVQLGRTAQISARVLDAADAPAAGARVTLAGSGIWPPRQADTNADGEARFEELPAGVYELRAVGGGAASAPTEGLELALGVTQQVTLRLEPGMALRGVVTDAQSGDPVADAEVVVAEDALSATPQTTRSGPDGSFALEGLRPVEHRVSLRAAGYVALTGQARLADGSSHAFALERAANLAGRIVDEAGAPVPDAELELAGSTRVGAPVSLTPAALRFQAALFASQLEAGLPLSSGDTLGVTHGQVPKIPLTPTLPGAAADAAGWGATAGFRSDAAGAFKIDGVPAGSLQLLARKAGFATTKSARIDLGPGQVKRDVVLTLRAGGSVVGRVVDARGFPAEGVRVELRSPDEPLPRVALSDDAGGFRFEGVRGAVDLSAHALGHAPVHGSAQVSARAEAEVTLTLAGEAASLEGRVLDPSGFPVEGAALRVTAGPRDSVQRSSLSAVDGTFRVGGLPAPPYAVRVDHPDFAPASLSGVGREELVVSLAPGLRYPGRVLDDHADAPLSGARVILRSAQLVMPRQVSTNAQGRFEFGNLPAGDYEVTVLHRGFVSARRKRAVDGAERSPEVGEFRLTPAGSVAGAVVDRLGRPAAGAQVTTGEPPDWSRAVRTDDRGEFELPELPPGDQVLSARHHEAGEAVAAASARVYPLQRSPGLLLRLPAIAAVATERATPASAVDGQAAEGDPTRVLANAAPGTDPGAASDAPPVAAAGAADGQALVLANQGSSVVVEAVAPGSAAARAGVRVGDQLRAVDGEPVLTAAQGRGMLRGTPGAALTLELARGDSIHRVRLRR